MEVLITPSRCVRYSWFLLRCGPPEQLGQEFAQDGFEIFGTEAQNVMGSGLNAKKTGVNSGIWSCEIQLSYYL